MADLVRMLALAIANAEDTLLGVAAVAGDEDLTEVDLAIAEMVLKSPAIAENNRQVAAAAVLAARHLAIGTPAFEALGSWAAGRLRDESGEVDMPRIDLNLATSSEHDKPVAASVDPARGDS